ncbi:MAG: hypothetical protein IJA59_09510 [Clostridia bacterium]|nr:hypothetical protein [Clostridia bacterium]
MVHGRYYCALACAGKVPGAGGGAFYSMLGADPLDSNIRIAPTYPCLADLTNAMEIFSLCVKISSVHKYLTDLHQDCPAD